MPLTIAKTTPELQSAMAALRARGRVALVPTMGALHDGHMALVAEAKRHAESVLLYIFVNPKQFAPHEDLNRYPRTFEADVELCRAAGVDVVYAPSVEDVYPPGDETLVHVGGPSAGLESDFRPHFFDGVATVLARMFTHIGADVAVFGEKDYQQLQVVRQLVRDMDLPVDIIGVPTVREADGLAMSSRNAYLSAKERAIAPKLYAILKEATAADAALIQAEQKLLDAGFAKVDYVALRDAETLGPVRAGRPMRLLAAAWLGTTRLIDNIPL